VLPGEGKQRRGRFARAQRRSLRDLNLTDEQKDKIAPIRKRSTVPRYEAGNKLRATVKEEVVAILAVIKG
jgi:hypothetical protein